MKKIQLTGTNLNVSVLALGTARYGTRISAEEAAGQIDCFLDLGGNMIDTAHAYGGGDTGEESLSEKAVGAWIRKSGRRNEIVLSTKGGHPKTPSQTDRRVNVVELEKDLEESLRNLQTDYVDMYFLHRDDPDVPVEELLAWLEQKVKEGKIRYYGCSNWSLLRIMEAQNQALLEGWKGFACNQAMGCLADVHPETLPPSNVVMDREMRTYHEETRLGFMAYMAVARGYLYKKLNGMSVNQEGRDNFECASNDRIVEKIRELAPAGYSVLDYSYQYLVSQKFPVVAVSGFSSLTQMKEAAAALEHTIPEELMRQVADLKELQR